MTSQNIITDRNADVLWAAPRSSSRNVVHLDLELAGTLDLREVGVDVWAHHPKTTLILVGFAINDDPAQCFSWNDGLGWPTLKYELMREAAAGTPIHAWNAAFERTIWNAIMVKGGMPVLPLEQFHCTMATAANAGLPMALDDAAAALATEHQKDKWGHSNMLRMARPRGFDTNGEARWWHAESIPHLSALADYNAKDVEAERDIYRRIPRMTQAERDIWLIDQRMNDRGLPVDRELLGMLGGITLDELLRLNQRIARITKGEVANSSQRGKLFEWLKHEGYTAPDLRKDTLKDFIGSSDFYDMTAEGQEVLELRAEAAKTSTAKLNRMEHFTQRDGRARHLVQYGGAVRTLRWAGRGPQIQNYPRPSIKNVRGAIDEILNGMPAEGLRLCFGKPLDVVASCLRGCFKAPSGSKFVVCDYHAIEAIVLGWLADDQKLLNVFRRGDDVYVYTANEIGSSDRQLGKVIRLACGYGMGPSKFKDTAKTYGLILSMMESEDAVLRFRNASRRIVGYWYACEGAAKNAILFPGQGFVVGKVKFRMALKTGKVAGALLIEKPNGGTLVYRDAKVTNGRISYWGVHQTTRQWTEIDTYGGKLVENITQAVARDLLAEAMKTFDAIYPEALLTTVHDEIIAQSQAADASLMLADLKQIMSTPPSWGEGLPLSAAGYVADRYAKA
jgi:DNA polymerase family A